MPTGVYKHKSKTEKHRRKLSEVMKGRPSSMLGKKHTQETKDKISKAQKAYFKNNPEAIERARLFGRKYGKNSIGRHPTEETKRKMGKANKGRKLSEEQKRMLSEIRRGEKNHFWKGGISFEPYSIDWTEDLKRAIRKRDKYTCQICGKEPSIIVHHIDYNKQNCNPDNLITLCKRCHNQTNFNRDYWTNYFTKLIQEL